MKVAAKFVGIRGSLAAVEHQEPDALKSIHELFRIARHAEQEGTAISNAVSEAIFTTGIRHLAVWAFLYRDQPAYRRAMKEAISAWPSVKMQEMHRGDLVEILQVVDMSTSAEGRQALGLKSDQVPASELFMPLITFRAKAKVRIAAAERRIWEAYGAPPGKRLPDLKVATDELSDALSAYPSGKLAYFSISQDAVNSPIVDQVWESRRLCFAAIYRALAGKTIATTIETKDLKSPFDGKPVQYRFDGRQMTITVSSPNDKINLPPLSFPNEMELGRVGKRKA
jgi:hypothetical protein